jgi:hypothetical protein
MDILRILFLILLVLFALTAEASGLVAVAALIDLLITPELFPNPGQVMGIAVAMFVMGNIIVVGAALSRLEWISEFGEERVGFDVGVGMKDKPKWWQDFGVDLNDHD